VFWALHQRDGSVAWKYKIRSLNSSGKNILSSPALHDEKVFFGAYDGNVYALSVHDGNPHWIYRGADWVGSSPAVAVSHNTLFVGLEFGLFKKHGGVVALDTKNGETKWEYISKAYTHASPHYVAPEDAIL